MTETSKQNSAVALFLKLVSGFDASLLNHIFAVVFHLVPREAEFEARLGD
jgi:hypothetical protein